MGPSSQGNNIAVERYLGSCLISSASRKPKKPPDDCNNLIIKQRQQQQQQQHYHHHHQQQQQQRHNNNYVVSPEYGNGWAGMPLISMANSRRVNPSGINKKQQQPQQTHPELQQTQQHQQNERSPLSRLAIHTQGAPLILSGNYGRKNGKTNTPAPLRIVLPRHPRAKEPPSTPSSPPASGSDSLSVASDESSGHSENSLPRIIKPRKRRKKERKPSLSTPENDTPAVTNPSIVTLQPYVPLCYEFDKFRQRSNNNTKINGTKVTDKVIGPPSKDIMRNVITPPATFEEIEEEIPASTVCQCRYCDPSGLIWDFDRRCYSPSLTSPSSMPPRLSSLPILRPSSGEYPWFISHESLRRSHSEPSNILPPVQRNNHYNNIIPHDNHTNVPTELSSSLSSSSYSKPTQELEVTSEIVTSLNGHRDIEIKFFLPSSLNSELSSSNREE